MSIERNNENFAPRQDDHSQAFRDQVFNPAEKQSLLPQENLSPRELLNNNDAIIADIKAHADRIAVAACKILSGLPTHSQESFMDGISCFTQPHDIVYHAVRSQWESTQTQTA